MARVCVMIMMMVAMILNVARGEPMAPCYFIFGDSLVDSGNNNQLQSLARADYFPYGIDFQFGPTGRFCNGKTTVDVITELLGFDDYITPYSQASGEDILGGVNYASAAAGVREETGRQLVSHSYHLGLGFLTRKHNCVSIVWFQGARITFAGQVANHVNTVSQVVDILGDENQAANYLSKCIYSIGLGSNDYLNNYFMPLYYSTGNQYSPDSFANDLINRYTEQLRILYNNGARKFALIGIGAIGCSPNELAQNSRDGTTCDERINSANRIFNSKLVSLVDHFNQNTPDAKFTYINAYGIFQDMVANPSRYGFRVTNAGCCGVGRNNGQITCLPGQAPCLNRDEFVFWDAFHPGEAANIVIGSRSFRRESPSDAHPYDIQQLALL
ncbi:hypothetical protein YC2023_087012 [Brassica napus]